MSWSESRAVTQRQRWTLHCVWIRRKKDSETFQNKSASFMFINCYMLLCLCVLDKRVVMWKNFLVFLGDLVTVG